jgi:hypothetical protein
MDISFSEEASEENLKYFAQNVVSTDELKFNPTQI